MNCSPSFDLERLVDDSPLSAGKRGAEFRGDPAKPASEDRNA